MSRARGGVSPEAWQQPSCLVLLQLGAYLVFLHLVGAVGWMLVPRAIVAVIALGKRTASVTFSSLLLAFECEFWGMDTILKGETCAATIPNWHASPVCSNMFILWNR